MQSVQRVKEKMEKIEYPAGSTEKWFGGVKHKFRFEGHDAFIVEPEKPAEGVPWSWCLEWPDAFVERCAAPELLAKGFHHVHVNVHGTWASPEGMKVLEAFYAMLMKLGFHKKAMLMGLSMGGLYSFRFAMENPEKVAVIYGDAPVCDLREYPEGNRGKVYAAYGFKSPGDPRISKLNPMEHLDILVRAKIPVILVVGTADEVVIPALHSDRLEKRYRELGGEIKVLRRPYVGHHPHGYDDPSQVVDFVLAHSPA
ncbi:MAG: Alpha/beta hydrolase family protein [Lentisphaerae bacterium ADurb.Bin242]|nr:MAG: Alpha/beta hydrolase family protein [Lentisphaerae bacterium ADurb.Bin242]